MPPAAPPLTPRVPAPGPSRDPAPSHTTPPPPPPPPVAPPPLAPRAPQPVRVGRPDVAIVDADYAAQQTRTGQLITVKVTLRNLGDGIAQGLRLSCAAGSRGPSQLLSGALGPGQMRTASCQVSIPASAQAARIAIAVSAQGDTNAGNNHRLMAIQAGRRR
jgi:hypothetical protein